ncbi:glycosyltransferase [Paenibacillus kobensis]|uniref:glycosyltransferase n=1 Tax=Paenibacillus kobensis TaxID=59841 RepID=UPI000FD9EDF8|nr:glycosyltransferase [Paenibacillus kobensis]
MTKFAIVSQRLLGHLIPALGLGRELKRRGHEVHLLGHPDIRHLAEKEKMTFHELREDEFPDKKIGQVGREILLIHSIYFFECFVCDSAMSAPAYVAEHLNLPWISFQTTVLLSDEQVPGSIRANDRLRVMYRDQLNEFRRELGLRLLNGGYRTRGDLAGASPYLHLVMTYPQMNVLPDNYSIPGMKFVGPCGVELPLAQQEDSESLIPRILICTTSITDRPKFEEHTRRYLNACLQGLNSKSLKVTISAQFRPLDSNETTGNIEYSTDYPLHDAALSNTDLVITHGGCSTLQRVMLHGIPMIVIPLGSDHRILADKVLEFGSGVLMEPQIINEINLWSTVQQVLNNPAYKQNALRLASRLRESPPANQVAADAVEQFLEGSS